MLAWLQCSDELSAETTGYVCDALLLWVTLGGRWPDPAEPSPAEPPPAGPVDYLQVLVEVTGRLLQRAVVAVPRSRRLELAHVGRLLGQAIRWWDPTPDRGHAESSICWRKRDDLDHGPQALHRWVPSAGR